MEVIIEREPSLETANQIYKIAKDYVKDYFTENLPNDTKNDLLFQQAMCLKKDKEIISFIVFTCWDGSPHITLMATKRSYAGKGYGKNLMQHFINHINNLEFNRIELFTVPPRVKPAYATTVAFYQSVGFIIEREYSQLWENGAIKMIKTW